MKLVSLYVFIMLFVACSNSKKLTRFTNKTILHDSAMLNTTIGISLYDADAQKFIFNHNSEKYFVPASNTKILTCYTAMQYLSDSIIGLKYTENDTALFIQGAGDPTFMVDEFKTQRVNDFLQKINKPIYFNSNNWKEERWGSGWNWTDFGENYCQERSALPMYYNSVAFTSQNIGSQLNNTVIKSTPAYFNKTLKNIGVDLNTTSIKANLNKAIESNVFTLSSSKSNFQKTVFSFTTDDTTIIDLLKSNYTTSFKLYNKQTLPNSNIPLKKIHSQHTDSLLKPMMHRSDNFFAEQSLLMASNEKLGYMNDAAIIDYVKKNDFIGIPQMPRWVDGSGLSRYNMFTPQSLVWVLNKMKTQFGLERLKEILPTGGEGTLSSLYKNINGKIFAKTGTLSNHAALSGFLITEKGKLYIFSILASGYQGSATPVRKAVEKYLQYIQKNN